MRDRENANPQGAPILKGRATPADLFLAFVGLYLVFSTVWAPKISVFRYENARWFQLILLTSIVLLLASPEFRSCVYQRWAALKRLPRVLIAVALLGGALSAVLSPAVPPLP